MKIFFGILFLFFFIAINCASSQDWHGSVIDNPILTSRCQELTEDRNNKVIFKQRLMAILKRNERLQKIAPANKLKVKKILEINHRRLVRELYLTKLKLTNMEENIIRKGCPGIIL